jgi:hypothetical protein
MRLILVRPISFGRRLRFRRGPTAVRGARHRWGSALVWPVQFEPVGGIRAGITIALMQNVGTGSPGNPKAGSELPWAPRLTFGEG